MSSIDTAWRRIVQGQNHRTLANLSYRLAMEVLKWAIKAGMLNQKLMEEISNNNALIDKNDLSETAKFFYKTFSVLDPIREHREFKMRLSTIRHKSTRELMDQCRDPQERLQIQRASRINEELERLFQILAMVRNVDAHQKQNIDDLGWSCMIAGVALRVAELAPVQTGDEKRLADLRTAIFDIQKSLFLEDPTGDFQPIKDLIAGTEGSQEGGKPEAEDLSAGITPDIVDTIIGIKDEVAEISEKMKELSIDAEDENETALEEPALTSSEKIYTVEQARQQLLKIKQKIYDEQEKEGTQLPPAQHILQRPIIEATLINRPQTFNEWKSLPDIGWRLLKHHYIMSQQLKRWGGSIEEVLQRLEPADTETSIIEE